MVEIKENILDINTFINLRALVGWKVLSEEQAKKALTNSLITISAYVDDKIVGMGRLVGDGAVICYIQDLVVHPDYRKIGVGDTIMKRLLAYVQEIRIDDTEMMLCLMCAKGREKFYEKYGFIARPTQNLGPGMIQYLNKQ